MQSSKPGQSLVDTVKCTGPTRGDWLRASLLSGFVATFAMTATVAVGYGLARGLADQTGSTVQRWAYGLTENRLINDINERFLLVMIANLLFGLIWALAYARFVGQKAAQPGWKSGAMFSIVPWLLSITVFFPIAGAGFLGSALDAGPLPVLGNLILHLVFGAVLGSMYAIQPDIGLDNTRTDRYAAATAERGAAIGMAAGGVVGAIGGWFLADQFDRLASQPVIAIAGALSAAAIGALLGSLAGMSEESVDSRMQDESTVIRGSMQES